MLPRVLLLLIVAAVAVGGWLATYALWRYQDATRDIGVLEPREFEATTLLTLGSGGELENPSRLGPAIGFAAGRRVVLIDAGRGVAESLRSSGVPVDQPESVYLTSLLPENTVGLDDLLTTGWRAGRSRPLRVVGPRGTRAVVHALERSVGEAVAALSEVLGLPPAGARFEVTELERDWSASDAEIEVQALTLEGGPLPALAYRFQSGGRSLVVGSVAFGAERLAELARGAHALVHGAVFVEAVEAAIAAGVEDPERLRREAALQLPLSRAGAIAQEAAVHRLVLVRLRPPPLFDFQFERIVKRSFSGEVSIARDGDEITL